MNDYNKMHEFLNSRDREGFLGFLATIERRTDGWHDGEDLVSDSCGAVISRPWPQWRRSETRWILESKVDRPNKWNGYCLAAGIDTDDAASLRVAEEANRIAKSAKFRAMAAIWVAIGSLFLHVAQWYRVTP